MYHEGGRVDTDTPEMAAARGQISAIQRQHRVQRRHGEEPSQTPTMSGLLRQQQPADTEDGAPSSAQPRESSVGDDDDSHRRSLVVANVDVPDLRTLDGLVLDRVDALDLHAIRLAGPLAEVAPLRNPLTASLTSLALGLWATTKRPHYHLKILRSSENSTKHSLRKRCSDARAARSD
ncbi:hypothetical protein C8A00DRAFT_39133, partial [Chaetomidium leptoderma]